MMTMTVVKESGRIEKLWVAYRKDEHFNHFTAVCVF